VSFDGRRISAVEGIVMSSWLSTPSLSVALSVTAGLAAVARATQSRALALAHPRTLRLARTQAMRLVTLVAGH
jgi:hypothetical protein